jgi:hypothetical protein
MTLRPSRLRIAAFAAALALPLVAAACSSPTGPGRDELVALQRAQAQWAALGARSYTFVVGMRCYCGVREIRATVVDGIATSRVFVDDGSPVPETQFHNIATVDAMFAHLDRAIQDHVFSFEASYDARGVPVDVQIDYWEDMIDEEFGWVVRSLTVTP